jgi:hypothetical protein
MNKTPASLDQGQPPAVLVRAVRKLLRPLIRLLITRGITYPALIQMLKSLYVEVAEHDFALDNKRQTDSRINLLTGIHRKDVKRLRQDQGDEDHIVPAAVSLGAQLVARWIGLEKYLDKDGNPRPLPRQATHDNELSFEQLVASVNKDIRPRVVLDEWLNLGVARLDDKNHVCLNTDAFIPEQGFDELAYYFGRNLHDHIAAAAHNISGLTPRQLERSVYYDGLTSASVKTLNTLAEKEGMKALQAVNRSALQLQKDDANKQDAFHRINFGIYFHQANADNKHGDES